MELPAIIKQLRIDRGLKVREFVAPIGVTQDSYQKWVKGGKVSDENLRKIEEAYGVRFVPDADGIIRGIRTISSDDIDTAGQEYDIPLTIDLSEKGMIDQYEAVAKRASLPHWEDLDEDVRAQLRAEMEVTRTNIERVLLDFREATIRIARRRGGRKV